MTFARETGRPCRVKGACALELHEEEEVLFSRQWQLHHQSHHCHGVCQTAVTEALGCFFSTSCVLTNFFCTADAPAIDTLDLPV